MKETDPKLEECVDRIRRALDHAANDDELQCIEVDLQHAVAALGISPKHIYPDDEDGPEYWSDADIWPNDPWLNEGGQDIKFVVITDDDGPFEEGELLTCAPVPGGTLREIGSPSRKPVKWDCQYEIFDSARAAATFRESLRPTDRGWVPGTDTDGDK